MSTSTKRTISPDKPEWAGIFLIAALGLIQPPEAVCHSCTVCQAFKREHVGTDAAVEGSRQ